MQRLSRCFASLAVVGSSSSVEQQRALWSTSRRLLDRSMHRDRSYDIAQPARQRIQSLVARISRLNASRLLRLCARCAVFARRHLADSEGPTGKTMRQAAALRVHRQLPCACTSPELNTALECTSFDSHAHNDTDGRGPPCKVLRRIQQAVRRFLASIRPPLETAHSVLIPACSVIQISPSVCAALNF